MGYVAVAGVWLITGSQDVGGFRWYFITLASPFLIKSRPTLSLCWVTSSICICVCVCLYTEYILYTCVCTTPLDTIDLDHTHHPPPDIDEGGGQTQSKYIALTIVCQITGPIIEYVSDKFPTVDLLQNELAPAFPLTTNWPQDRWQASGLHLY